MWGGSQGLRIGRYPMRVGDPKGEMEGDCKCHLCGGRGIVEYF